MRMTQWIIIGGLYPLILLAFTRLGGLGAVAEGLREWGNAASELGRMPASSK
jgi:hypothetical protein